MSTDRPHVDSATLRGSRAVGIVCAIAFFAIVVLSLVFPRLFFFQPYHIVYERLHGAAFVSFGLGLLLAARDPSRNAGVYALIGLASASLAAAIAYTLVFDEAEPVHWFLHVPLLAAVGIALVVTYTRLRRPHPIVVRIVIAAVAFMPVLLFLYDAAYRVLVAR